MCVGRQDDRQGCAGVLEETAAVACCSIWSFPIVAEVFDATGSPNL